MAATNEGDHEGEHDRPLLPADLARLAPSAMQLLVEAAQVVHGPADLETKLDWIIRRACEAAGSEMCAFVQLTDDGEGLWTVAGSAVFDHLPEPVRVEVIRRTVRGGEPTQIDTGARVRAGRAGVGGLRWLLAVPVPKGEGRPHGALLAGTIAEALDGGAESALRALAAHLGIALDNLATVQRLAELEAAQREVVHQLQEAVRPPVPTVAGAELGVYYLPADPASPTGGDLYDWLLLPDGDLHLAIVDVLGKGVAATKDALAVTHVLRLLVLDGCPLERLVTRADSLVTIQNPDLVATVLVARYTPSTGVLRLAGAGHPPAVLVGLDRTVRQVAAPGVPIGWPGAGTSEVVTVTLDRSETAIFYTDGLVEAQKDIIAGLHNLEVAAAETAHYPAPHLARALVDRALAGANRRDDTLALALRRRTPPTTGERPLGPFEYRFSPSLANVSLVRHFLADWLTRQHLDQPDVDDLLLVASELCSNAIRASSGRPASLSLRARTEGDAVVLEVEDDGGGLDLLPLPGDELPDPDAEQGRGLFLVRALTDEVASLTVSGHTVIRAVKRAVISGQAVPE
jgi:serine phosphatase RsbU (regulator of sigma subunit)/anti-sigma regulatory factor (Ser/Thr protein kinase)